jgi:putative phage-type endonuclease
MPPAEDREAWILARRNYIGGTDVAAIVGKHKYKTALGVYAEKVLGVVDDEQSILAMMGLALEPVIRIVVERDTKRPVLPSEFGRHPKFPRLAVNPDGEFSDEEGCELKTHGYATKDEWGEEMTDEVPDAYHVQATWQCGIKGWKRCYIVAFDRDKGTARYYCVEANPDYFNSLVTIADRFDREHILAKVEPKATSDSDLDIVRTIYRTQETELLIATDEHDELVADYMALTPTIAGAKKEQDRIKAILIQAIGSAQGLKTSHGPVTYKPRNDGVRVFRAPTA